MGKKNDLSNFDGFIKQKISMSNNSRDVLSYTRVSSKKQSENNDSLNTQRKKNSMFCQDKGYNIIDSFGGTYESAKGDYTREEFNKLLDYIKRSKIKPYAVVVFMVNRFSRSGASSIGILHELVYKYNVHLIESSSGLDTTTQRGFIQITEKLLDSRKENLVRQETVVPGMKGFLSKGYKFGTTTVGYDHYGPRVKNPKFFSSEQRITINGDGMLLREGFQWKLSGNYSDSQILQELRKRGLIITKQKISKVWRNPFYCGISTNSLLDGKKAVEGKWEKMISVEDFWRLQDILNKNTSGYKHNKQVDYKPLTGFIKCGKCENRMVGYMNKKKKLPYYRCNYCLSMNINGMTTPKSRRKGVNDLFKDFLSTYEINPTLIPLVEIQLRKIYQHYNEVEFTKEQDFQKRIKVIQDKIDRLDVRLGLDEISLDVHQKTKVVLESELLEIKKSLNNLGTTLSNQESFIEKSLRSLVNISKIWGSIGLREKQKLQNTLFPDGVYYDKENHSYLTKKVNSFVILSNCLSTTYVENKEGTNHPNDEKSLSVPESRLELPTFGL